MATQTPFNLAADRQKVRGPLDRLRGTIRRYVGLEGLAIAGVFVALSFWLGMLFDFGAFKLLGIDWVQQELLPRGVRLGILLTLGIALLVIVGVQIFTRLFREFRDPALALVLERRFPRELGDRLITAVELADVEKATHLGFSAAMVQETIHEAAERVESLPVHEVLDWKRLYRWGLWVVLLTLMLYLLVGSVFAGLDRATGDATSLGGFGGLHRTSVIWFERNVLLRDTMWPRRAHLVLLGWPDRSELRIGRDATPPPVHARALQYVIHGKPSDDAVANYKHWLSAKQIPAEQITAALETFQRTPKEGWRALTWFDLSTALLDSPLPSPSVLPADWTPRDLGEGMTLDEIESRLAADVTHQSLPADATLALRDLLTRVDERAAEPSQWRTLRKLVVPPTAYLHYSGLTTSARTTLERGANNEYTGQFGDLKEDIRFRVQGEDYYTPARAIAVVPPPTLEQLTAKELRPAYLYYRPGPLASAEALRGQRQSLVESPVSITGGDTSRLDVPAGTTVILSGVATKELKSVRLLPRKGGADVKADLPTLVDEHTFEVRFPNVREETGLVLELTDTDDVVGLRQVLIRPAFDQPPDVDAGPDEIIRRTRDGYLVTPLARIPFNGMVKDDNGLAVVRYAWTASRVESTAPGSRLLDLAGLVPLTARTPFLASGYLATAFSGPKPSETRYLDVPRFLADLRERPDEALPLAAVQARLAEPQRLPYRQLLREFPIRPDVWDNAETDPLGTDFPLWTANLKAADERQVQDRYRVQLWLEAIDTDLESERDRDGAPRPHLSPSKEKFTFLVVSETELLAEIAKEEEQLHVKLDETLNRLLETEAKLVQVNVDLSAPSVRAENLGPMSARSDEIEQVLDASQTAAKEVLTKYQRILRELKTNRVDPKMIERVAKTIVAPMERIELENFPAARAGVTDFKKALDAADLPLSDRLTGARSAGARAKEEVRRLIAALNNVMGAMQKIIDINLLISKLRAIEEEEQKQFDLIRQIKEKYERELLEGLLEPKK